MSEMNELENWLHTLAEIADSIAPWVNDDIGNMNLESQQNELRESEQGNSQLSKTNTSLSTVDYSNENTTFNLAPDTCCILLKEANSLGVGSSDRLAGVPPLVFNKKEKEVRDYSSTSSVFKSLYDTQNVATEFHMIKSIMGDYKETFLSMDFDKNEGHCSAPLTACSNEENRLASEVSYRHMLSNNNACIPKPPESSEKHFFSYYAHNPITMGNNGNCSFSYGQGNDDVNLNDEVHVILKDEDPPQIKTVTEPTSSAFEDTESMSATKSHVIQSNIGDYKESFSSMDFEKNEDQCLGFLTDSSNEEYRSATDIGYRRVLSNNNACVPKAYESCEKNFLSYYTQPTTMSNIGNGFSSYGQGDDDVHAILLNCEDAPKIQTIDEPTPRAFDMKRKACLYDTESVATELPIIQSNVGGYEETFSSMDFEKKEDQCSASLNASLKEEHGSASDVGYRHMLSYSDACGPKSFESSEINYIHNPITMGNIGNCSFSNGQGDQDVLALLQNCEDAPQIQTVVEVASQAYDNRSSEHIILQNYEDPLEIHTVDREASQACDNRSEPRSSRKLTGFGSNTEAIAGVSGINPSAQCHLQNICFICSICGKSFFSQSQLGEHYRTHIQEKPFACNEYGKRFSCKYNLKTYQRIHTGDMSYECATCGKTFTRISYCKKHQSACKIRTELLSYRHFKKVF